MYIELQDYVFYFAIIMLVVILLFLMSVSIYSTVRMLLLIHFFTEAGYERKFLYTSSIDGTEYWGWFRRRDDMTVRDIDIESWSLKRIRYTYK